MADKEYRKITKASVKFQDTIYLRVGPELELEIRKEGNEFYLVEPKRATDGKLKDCDGSLPLLNGAHLVIGRQEITSQCLDMPDSTSRQHLLIKREFDMFYFFDLHSKNGSFLKV